METFTLYRLMCLPGLSYKLGSHNVVHRAMTNIVLANTMWECKLD